MAVADINIWWAKGLSYDPKKKIAAAGTRPDYLDEAVPIQSCTWEIDQYGVERERENMPLPLTTLTLQNATYSFQDHSNSRPTDDQKESLTGWWALRKEGIGQSVCQFELQIMREFFWLFISWSARLDFGSWFWASSTVLTASQILPGHRAFQFRRSQTTSQTSESSISGRTEESSGSIPCSKQPLNQAACDYNSTVDARMSWISYETLWKDDGTACLHFILAIGWKRTLQSNKCLCQQNSTNSLLFILRCKILDGAYPKSNQTSASWNQNLPTLLPFLA